VPASSSRAAGGPGSSSIVDTKRMSKGEVEDLYKVIGANMMGRAQGRNGAEPMAHVGHALQCARAGQCDSQAGATLATAVMLICVDATVRADTSQASLDVEHHCRCCCCCCCSCAEVS
jgi:predicted HD phosphohydrolase